MDERDFARFPFPASLYLTNGRRQLDAQQLQSNEQ